MGRDGLPGDDKPGWPSGRGRVRSGLRIGIGRGGLESSTWLERPYSVIPGTPGEVSRRLRSAEAWDEDSLGSAKGFSDSGVVSVDWAVVEVKGPIAARFGD